jgi:hypothetical protein
MVSPGKPAAQQFQAFGTLAGGAEQDITGMVSWSTDRPALATTDACGPKVARSAARPGC